MVYGASRFHRSLQCHASIRRRPGPGGWNRIHLIVNDLSAEVARLRAAGVQFRNEIVTGPGGSQILLQDPAGNLVELFQPAAR
jgi:catechol 2,3-dioxygenase-like lactoylglutathione lyase family enzyme